MLLGYAILLFTLSVILVKLFQYFALRGGWVDEPNARSAHRSAKPRGAGVVFVALWLLTLTLAYAQKNVTGAVWCLLFPAVFIIGLVGFIDDKRSLPTVWRFACQVVVAGLCVFQLRHAVGAPYGLFEAHAFLQWGVLAWFAFGIVWSINLFNFMDGLDGLAGSEAAAVFALGGGLFWLAGAWPMAYLAWALMCCVLGFLVWNWPQASVFMGDVGSYALGLLIALFALIGYSTYHIPLGLWFILYAVFLFDASLTLLRRMWHGEAWYSAHKSHAYQRLHQFGCSARTIVCGTMALNVGLGGLAWWVYNGNLSLMAGLAITVFSLSIIYGIIELKKPMFAEE